MYTQKGQKTSQNWVNLSSVSLGQYFHISMKTASPLDQRRYWSELWRKEQSWGAHNRVLPWGHNCMSCVSSQLHGMEAGMVQNFITPNVSQGPSPRQLAGSTHHSSHSTCSCHTHTTSPSYLLLFFRSPNQTSILRPSRLGQIPFLVDLHSSHFLLSTLS